MNVIGLCGGVASGKSFVAQSFRDEGCAVFDADYEAHIALDKAADKIRATFGNLVVTESNTVDRKAIAQIVFDRPDCMIALEQIVHPLVEQELNAFLELEKHRSSDVVVLDIPLLFEKGINESCDSVVYVYAPEQERLKRALARGWSEESFKARESCQVPLIVKETASDVVIVSYGSYSVASAVKDFLATIKGEE